MLAQQPTFDHSSYEFSFDTSKIGIRTAKSELNEFVEYANTHNMSLHFEHLDEIINERHPTNCTHHMQSCVRVEDPIFEIASYMKAVELIDESEPDIHHRFNHLLILE